MENKIVGVIGGMGPHASNRFMELIYTYKKLKKDHLYPRIILDSNTKIPSRTRSIIYNEKSPLNGMIESANKLHEFGVNAIALPCNTAHIWIQSLQKKIKIPIFDITDIVTKRISENYKSREVNIYIFGTFLTTEKKLYITKLSKSNNIKIISINNEIQKKIGELIYLIKENSFKNSYKKKFHIILKSLELKLLCTRHQTVTGRPRVVTQEACLEIMTQGLFTSILRRCPNRLNLRRIKSKGTTTRLFTSFFIWPW